VKPSFFGITDIGLSRANNEDAFAVIEEKKFFVLADGMGGHLAGEVAAATALDSVCTSIHAAPDMSIEKTCIFLRGALARANAHVLQKALSHPNYTGMGTTLSCFVLTEQHLVYAHIGDSRLYRYRHRLLQLTEDHSLRKRSRSASSIYRNHHIITRALGTPAIPQPDIGIIPLHSNDLYLLCSDGLSDYVPEEQIAHLLSSPLPIQERGNALIKAALEKGGRDNITLLLVHVE
jgi:protein phosphatase